jgi:DNA-binding transcriptional regulator YhcF (GntR family)
MVDRGVTASARLRIDTESFVPLMEQIRREIADQAASGLLPPGTRLPTVRQLARDLNLAPGTVAKAYQILEADRVIETRGRRGSFVADRPRRTRSNRDMLEVAARRYLDEAHRLGASVQVAAAIVSAIASSQQPVMQSPESKS